MTAPTRAAAERSGGARVVRSAAGRMGLDVTGARLLRAGSNEIWLLPRAEVVARVGRPHTAPVATRELRIASWLARAGIRANAPVARLGLVVVDARPVTWWKPLGEHRHATTAELGDVLRRFHALSPPAALQLPAFDPLAGVLPRIAAAEALPRADRDWLLTHAARLRRDLDRQLTNGRRGGVHGDAWQGNVAVPADGVPVLLDLERVAVGHPDWDLIPVAVDHTDFARLTPTEYDAFVSAYGRDVTTAPWFRTMADVQELRWTTFVAGLASTGPDALSEVTHRVACLRGDVPRPWTWRAF